MKSRIKCPVCYNDDWNNTGNRINKITDSRWKYGYPKVQKYVFFNIWHKNKSPIILKRNVCKMCGFVTDMPRPDEKDIERKYQYLSKVEKDLGSAKGISKNAMKKEFFQSELLLKSVKKHTEKSKLNILDHGGGDGHFMIPMKKKENSCYLIDYNQFPVQGIKRLGSTLESIPKKIKFDLIICRHVLEHVASPRKIIFEFKKYIKDQGIVYAEVPIQLYGENNPNKDPVTHVNYFQEDSFRRLFEETGYEIISAKRKSMIYHGDPTIVAQVLGKKGKNNMIKITNKNSYEKTMSLINMSPISCYKERIFAHPVLFIVSFIKRRIRQTMNFFLK